MEILKETSSHNMLNDVYSKGDPLDKLSLQLVLISLADDILLRTKGPGGINFTVFN